MTSATQNSATLMHDPTLDSATSRDSRAATDLLVEVFDQDPAWIGYYEDPGRRRRALGKYYSAALRRCLATGNVDVVQHDGELLAVALWEGPETAQHRPLGQRLLRRLGHALHGRTTTQEWRLEGIVVSPSARGRGLGGLLLRHGLARVDEEGLSARLESTTAGSRRLYERHGFAVAGPAPRNRPAEIPMVRPVPGQ